MGLAVGIAAATLIFLWVENLVNFNKDIPNLKNIYEVGQHQFADQQTYTFFVAPGPLAQTLNESFPGIKNITRYGWGGTQTFTLENENKHFSETGNYADASTFEMIGMNFIKGNPKTAFDPAFPIVISEKMAEKFFGENDPIGKSLQDENKRSYQVTGVFKNLSKNISFGFEWLIPFRVLEKDYVEKGWIREGNWGNNWMQCYVELNPSANADNINQKLKNLLSEKTNGGNKNELFIYPLSKLRLYGEFVDGKATGSGYIRTVRLFFSIGLIILLIACINFMNLSTARSEKRSMEVGIRKTFGGNRSSLIRQFLGESGLITLISLLIAIGIVWLSLPAFNELVNKDLTLDFSNWIQVVGLLGIGIICTLLAGSYPAFYLSSFSPLTTLKKLKINGGKSVLWIRKSLVVFQFAITFILVCATLIIYLQIKYAQNRSLGFNKENLITFGVTNEIKHSHQTIKNELINTGFVTNAALSDQTIMTIGSNGWNYNWNGKDPKSDPLISHLHVTEGLLETVELKLIDGQDFSPSSTREERNVIINETLAKMMGKEGHVGGTIWQGKPENRFEIIGIVNDFVFNDIYQEKSEPVVIWGDAGVANYLFVRLKPDANVQEAIMKIKPVLQKFSPNESFDPVFMDEYFDNLFYNEQLEGKLAALFAGLAIFISCLGLFGLSAFSAEQRIKEIGIRKVLGAKITDIIVLMGKNFMLLILVALLIGIPIAYYIVNNYLKDYAYRISLSWTIFAGVSLLITLIAMLTVSLQSLRAATANPVKAIKVE